MFKLINLIIRKKINFPKEEMAKFYKGVLEWRILEVFSMFFIIKYIFLVFIWDFTNLKILGELHNIWSCYAEIIFKVKKSKSSLPHQILPSKHNRLPIEVPIHDTYTSETLLPKKYINVKYQSILYFLSFFYQEGVSQNHWPWITENCLN